MEGGEDTEQFRNLQESERYVIHVSGTKIKITETALFLPFLIRKVPKQVQEPHSIQVKPALVLNNCLIGQC